VLGRRSGVSERLCEQLAVPLQHCVMVSHALTHDTVVSDVVSASRN